MYQFHDRFITRGEEGGREAVDALCAAMLQYVRDSLKLPDKVDVVVKAFASVAGLGKTLERNGKLGNVDEMRKFAAEFSNRKPFFDFVDVGYGKDRADVKLQGEWATKPQVLIGFLHFHCPIRSILLVCF